MLLDDVLTDLEGWPVDDLFALVLAGINILRKRSELAAMQAQVAASDTAIDVELAEIAKKKP